MTGPEHYAEAERLSEMYREGSSEVSREWAMDWRPWYDAASTQIQPFPPADLGPV